MASAEFSMSGNHAYGIAEELVQSSSIKGFPYTNITVTTSSPDFTDVYDPEVRIEHQALTMYWPSGSPAGTHDFETIVLSEESPAPADAANEVVTIRNALVSASIGKAALGRIPPDLYQYREGVKILHPAPILLAEEQCAGLGLPLAVCQTSRVVESDLALVGARMMHLWHPNYVSPKPVLARLRQVVKHVISQELL